MRPVISVPSPAHFVNRDTVLAPESVCAHDQLHESEREYASVGNAGSSLRVQRVRRLGAAEQRVKHVRWSYTLASFLRAPVVSSARETHQMMR